MLEKLNALHVSLFSVAAFKVRVISNTRYDVIAVAREILTWTQQEWWVWLVIMWAWHEWAFIVIRA